MADVIHLINDTIRNDGSSIGYTTMTGVSQILRPSQAPSQAIQLAEITAQSGILDDKFDDVRYYTGDATT